MSRPLTSRLILGLALLAAAMVLTLTVLIIRSPASAMGEPTTAPAPLPPMDAKPLVARGGIPNVAAKLKAGRPVTVAFLGGPITASGGSSGFAALVHGWLTSQYVASRPRIVSAGLIDGGSMLGAMRVDRDVFPQKPDLLFIEFAVDDDPDTGTHHIERLVRKVIANNPRTDIVFIHAMSAPHVPEFRAGKLPPAASAHERVAAYYDLPSISMAGGVLAELDAGKRGWADLFSDEWRPTRIGHAAYADAVIAGLRDLLREPGEPRDHVLKEPPMNERMVLYPTTRPAVPLVAPKPLADAKGNKALESWAMPIVGKHWVGSPEFKNGSGHVLWRMYAQSVRDNGRRLNADFGLDRSRWGQPLSWMDEYNCFTGPSGVYLVHAPQNASGNHLTVREDDLPLVTFTAPRTGRYAFNVRSGDAVFWGLNRALAMNVVHFVGDATKGTSLAFQRSQLGIADRLNLSGEVQLLANDTIAFELDTNATGGGGAAYTDTEIIVGWFKE